MLTSQGRTLAISESYTRKISCEKAIESFRKGAVAAPVADLTLAPAKAPAAAKATAKRAAKRVKKATTG